MATQNVLTGPYVRINDYQIRRRADLLTDPRNIFYKAMLFNKTYEAYYAEVGNKEVLVESWHPPKLMDGYVEIWYAARNRHWLKSASA